MARIRSIKPEFPQSESIGRLSRDARLLFIQLWTFVDDSGRARAASRMLASQLYPYDDDAPSLMEAWLAELEQERCIRRYDAEGNRYLEVVNWLKHQKIDRPTSSRLPEFIEGSSHPRECSRGLDADLGPRTLDLGPKTKTVEREGASFSEWDFLSEDGKVQITKEEIEAIEKDLPNLKNVRGLIRNAARSWASADVYQNPKVRKAKIIASLSDKDTQSADRREAMLLREKREVQAAATKQAPSRGVMP